MRTGLNPSAPRTGWRLVRRGSVRPRGATFTPAADQVRAKRFITSHVQADALDDDGDNRPSRGKLKSRTRGEAGNPMNLVQFKRHDADGDVFINPAPTSRWSNRAVPATTQAGRGRIPSDHDAFDLVERDRVRRPVVQLRRPGRRMAGNLLRVLKRPPVR